MSIFRRPYKDKKTGKEKKVKNYTVEFNDHEGNKHRVVAFSDKAASIELERNLMRLVALRIAGAGPDAELSRFLESCPAEIRERLGEWGIIDGQRAAAGKAMAAHIEDWQVAMEAKGNCRQHVRGFVANLKRLVKACKWRQLSDISASDVNRWIPEKRTARMSAATINHYIRSAKAFCNWLVQERKLSDNPLRHIAFLNVETDRRLERRAFTLEEIGRLLAAAEAGPFVCDMSGPSRALLYRLALETGLRYSELFSLTKSSFDLTGDTATVTIAADAAKNRKEAVLPIRADLANDLQASMALFLPEAKAFQGMKRGKGAEMIQADLEAAGIPYIDTYGLQGDFHALRHTFASLLNQARVPLATAQKMMRHSDPKLTANIYTHVLVETKAEALHSLPEIGAAIPQNETATKTGTDDDSGGGLTGGLTTEAGKSTDRPTDRNGPDSMAKIRTYTDPKTGEKAPFSTPFSSSQKQINPCTVKGCKGGSQMVAPQGFEPRRTDPESVVLPLDEGAEERTYIIHRQKLVKKKPGNSWFGPKFPGFRGISGLAVAGSRSRPVRAEAQPVGLKTGKRPVKPNPPRLWKTHGSVRRTEPTFSTVSMSGRT